MFWKTIFVNEIMPGRDTKSLIVASVVSSFSEIDDRSGTCIIGPTVRIC